MSSEVADTSLKTKSETTKVAARESTQFAITGDTLIMSYQLEIALIIL